MKPFRSLLFYAPIVMILIVDPLSQDIGLWVRFASASLLGLVGIYLYRKEINLGFTSISLMTIALLLSLMKIGQVSAPSELYGFAARISFLASWILIAKAAFKKDKENSLQALAMGSQIALIIASLSILPSLFEAYKADIEAYNAANIYLAHGPLFLHKNFAAATLLLLFPLTFLGNSKISKTNGLHITALVLAGLMILLLRTRGVWLGGLAMILVTAVHFILRGNKKLRQYGLIALAILIFGIGFTIALGGSRKIYDSGTVQSRLHSWDASWEMFLEHPVSGVGGGQWKIEYPAQGQGLKGTNESVMNASTTILRPHNDLLWMLSETGIFGGVLFVGILVIGFWRNFKKDGNIYMALVIVGFTVYGLGEFPLERASMLWPLAIALGYAASSLKQRIKGRANFIFAASLLTFTLVVSASRVMGEHKAEITRKEFQKTKGIPNIRIMKTNAESAQSTFFEMDIYNNPMAYWEGLAILYSAKNDEQRSRAKGAFKRSLAIYPNHINTLNDLASLHASLGELKKASELYDQVLKIAPRNRKAAIGQIRVKLGLADVYGSLKAMKMISQKELTEYHLNIDDPIYRRDNTQKMYMLDAYKEISVKTLKHFRSMNGPRPALKSLHAQLQGKNLEGIWEVWMNWRKK